MDHTYSVGNNPIIKSDYPDPDVIFFNGTFYMISTTMHFFPGGEILRSYDLVNWEHFSYVFERLDSTKGQRLYGNEHIYGKGMWAASLRYHAGLFYVVFVCNDTHKTYLFKSKSLEGEWEKSEIEGFYHDCSLLFDEGRTYIVYGNTDIYITELNDDLSAPKEGGLNRLIVSDKGNERLGFEGSHIYKINGRYYLFLIHSKREEWRRVEACFVSDSLEGEFKGGDIFDDDLKFRRSGVAQGGIVEGPEGIWNAVLFQDRGASGRMPILVPVHWNEDFCMPVFGTAGEAPLSIKTIDLNPGYRYEPLTGSDDLKYDPALMYEKDKRRYGCFGFKSMWQFNHEPDLSLIKTDPEKGELIIRTEAAVENIFHAKNILTQRMTFPFTLTELTIDGSMLNDGDHAGLAAFSGNCAMIGLQKKDGKFFAVMKTITNNDPDEWKLYEGKAKEEESIEIRDNKLRVRIEAYFGEKDEHVVCKILRERKYQKMGPPHPVRFRLDHFTGIRAAIFMMSEKEAGGSGIFSDFKYSVSKPDIVDNSAKL